MFDKLKQVGELNKLRQQAKKLQSELETIKHSEEKGKYKVGVTGAQKVIFIEIDGGEQKELVDLLNKALKEVQKKSAKKMLEMGGGLSGLLGKS